MASTVLLQDVVNFARSYPELTPILGTTGWATLPAIEIANTIMQRFLAEGMNWKWNRSYVPSILTVALQQDYLTQVTDLGWLEGGWRIDINNSTNNGNLAPKPIFTMEAVRELGQASYQANPFNMSFIPNSLAFIGTWPGPNVAISTGYGVAQIPIQPIQQFKDANGNLLYIDSTVLGLGINSPGFTTATIPLPTPNPYGITGTTAPAAVPNAAPGTKVTDGTVTWTVANPNAYAIRVSPLPAFSGLAWLMVPVYQRKPPAPYKFNTNLANTTIAPIPDELSYLFKQGFVAMCYEHAGSKNAPMSYAKWEENLIAAVRSGDREREDFVMYPSESIMGGGPVKYGLPVGPGWPYEYFGF
jgi:hypothetical protein